MGDDQHDEDSRNSSRPQQEVPPGRRSWASRHPVLAAILLPVIPGLIVGLIILVPDKFFDAKQDGNSSSQSPPPTQQASRTEPADRPPTVSAPATSSTSISSEDVRWSGTVNLTYLDLDSVPPRVVSGNKGASTWASYNYSSSKKFSEATLYGQPGDFFTVQPTIASWSNPAKPTRQQCADLIVTQGVESLPLSKNSSYCVKTAANRVAFITELSLSDAIHAYTAVVTVWSATS
ncbi:MULTISPECIES: hypothetical protein [unclassified Nocardia]|uniref:hypothetical protein n=1 Tax=unclassified Nocardia TaxID=2637762 RepID=UPI0034448F85